MRIKGVNIKSVIIDILDGVKGHRDHITLPKEILDGYAASHEKIRELKEKLDTGLQTMFDEYMEMYLASFSKELDFFYREGFCLGLQIGIECISG